MADFSKYENIIKNTLSERRFYHSMQVAAAAKQLAERYGADPDKAYFCGILHDIMKEKSYGELLDYCDMHGVALTDVERGTYKLLHGIAGADYIRRFLGVDDADIINAVRYHTTARAGMSLLEKIVYLADFTSADRDFDGVDKLRRAVQINIVQGMAESLAFSICEVVGKGNCFIHPDTVRAYNDTMSDMLKNSVKGDNNG